MLELAEIFQRYGPAYRTKFADRMPPSHLAAMQAIERCRTEALGGHVYQCPACGDLEYSYHSCKNRHCPKCQHEAATHWLAQQRALLLPVPYFLVTFTLPEELRPLARSHQRLMYNVLFQTSAAALQTLALDPHYLGGQIGMVGVLHTWTRDLAYHPHVHYLVPGGALSPEGSQWFSPKSAERPRHSCRGWIGVGRAGLNAQEPNKTHAVPEPSMGEGTAEVEAPAFMPGRMSRDGKSHIPSDLVVDSWPHMLRAAQPLISR